MSGNPHWYQGPSLQAAVLFVFSCLLYANTLGHDFALDDAIVITDNSVVQRGVAGWGDLFTHDSFYGFFDEQERNALVTGGRYRPLTLAMFSLEQAVSSGPFLHHLLNVLCYGLLVVVMFAVLRRLGGPWWLAVGVSALFAAHPLHTEAVANIKGRDEIIALLGALGATYFLLRSAEEDRFRGGVAGAGMFLLGCLAKENAITFVAVIPLLVFVFVGRGYRHLIPLLVAAAGYLLLRQSIVGIGGGEPPLEWMNNPFLRQVNGGWQPLTFFERQPTVLYTLLIYLKLLFVPTGLVHDYYPAAIELRGWGDPLVWLSLFVHLALLIWGALHLRSRHKIAATGVLIYLLTLSVVSNVVFNVGTFMSERFLFMPSFGFAIAVGGIIAVGARWFRHLPWVLPVVVVVYSGLTLARNPVWKDNFTLFTTDVQRQPNSAKLRNAAGGVRLDRYQSLDESRQAAQQKLLRDALTDLNEALRIHPSYRNAFLLRGNAHLLLNDYAAAIRDYDRALQLSADDADVRNNLVIALQRAGRAAGEERQDFAAALGYLQRADQLRPGDYETLRLLGIASGMSGKLTEAAEYFRRAVSILPDNAGAVRNYGTALYQLGRTEEARVLYERADRLEQ
ncbi:Tfp pilus assembly protein PilF [Lewinella aquimaris]|uniref:Tfp pilus assembly protein PilF n=1 Tax=Neolewinella aquimaris TaxID=1835722 RepID=A0A840E9J6_9BACT|nr:tetratricopeptide repeat protein [Neolewinella aquimaris]MBB4080613.1 Tfp pilus assembly protein PilF [Neolewinella aquimaris]